MALRFNDSEWERSNPGRRPRGEGSWAFGFVRDPAPGSDQIVFSPCLSLGAARRWARGVARERGFSGTLFLQP